jgi:uncharacterized protein (TIGR02231 family)
LIKKIILTLLIVGIWCGTSLAAAERIVFYPSGADFSQEVTVPVESDANGKYVVFTLSGQAIPETFTIASLTNGVAVNDVSWNRNDLSRSPAAVELGKKIEQLKFKLANILSEKKAVEGGISFWKERGKSTESKTSELDRIADLVVTNLGKLYESAAKLDVSVQDIKELIDELHRKLNEITGHGKMVWQVRVSVEPGSNEKASFKVGYMLRNCGWTPKYKLDAHPDSGLVKFSFDAEIRQGSGVDFNNCEVALATVKKTSRISPPNLPKWIVSPMPEVEPAPQMMMDEANFAVQAAAPRKLKARGGARRVSKATYSLWELGKKTIPAGTTRKYSVESLDWASEYSFLARPSLAPDVFVSARIKLNNAGDYPAGPALVFMEGTMIGKKNFSFSGKEKDIYFGSDPLLKVERKTLEKKSGEKGVFGSKQSYDWKYLIELENARGKAVKIKVEEPSPVSGDKRIKLEISAVPTAEVEDNNFEWEVMVPADGKAKIEYSISMTAPDDMNIDLGIGR